MKINSINDSNISGIKLIELNKFCDNRGYFSETYRSTDFSNNNLNFFQLTGAFEGCQHRLTYQD